MSLPICSRCRLGIEDEETCKICAKWTPQQVQVCKRLRTEALLRIVREVEAYVETPWAV